MANTRRTTQTLPAPAKKRISGFGQALFIGFALCIDFLELILDIFVIGIIANRVIDIVVAGIFFLYAKAKGLTFAEDAKVYASIGGTIIGEFIPGLDIAPFFTIDAWYITRSIKAKDRAAQQAVGEETQSITQEQERQDWIENYQQQQVAQAEEGNGQEANEQGDSVQATVEQEPPKQETNWQDNGGAGRIAPIKLRGSSNPQPTGKPIGNGGIIK